jgi:SRSO17 transposase
MDAQAIRQLEPQLDLFLGQFSDCFGDDTEYLALSYVRGQLSDLERKNVERIALAANLSPRTLQEFMANYEWDHEAMRTKLQRIVAQQNFDPNSIGIIDETSFPKKGTKTPGVQRQHCGALGKQDNCFVTVHLTFAAEDFHCLLDGDLFLPESWSNDRERCHAAKIPDHLVYRSRADIAMELYQRAVANEVRFQWLTFDEWYGAKPKFLSELWRQHQKYVGEIHCRHRMWTKKPRVTSRPYRKNGRGRSRKTPRLVTGSYQAITSQECSENDLMFTRQKWKQWHVKDTEKGAKVVEVKQRYRVPTG